MTLIELRTDQKGYLQAVFRFDQPWRMRVELSICLVGRRNQPVPSLSEVLKTLDNSRHCGAPPGAGAEFDWYQLMALIKRCHEEARFASRRVTTTVRIENEEQANETLGEAVVTTYPPEARIRVC